MTKLIKSKYQQVIEFVRYYQEENKRPPTIREIMESVGIKSTSVASYHLQQGVKRGNLEKLGEDGEARNYRAL